MTVTPVLRQSAAWHLARLESSDLYRRREADARKAQAEARLRAVFYLSPSYRARYEE